jgi:hypothetical protein
MTFGQRQCHLSTSAGHHPLEGRTGDAHTLGRLSLREAFKVSQTQRLTFLLEQSDTA